MADSTSLADIREEDNIAVIPTLPGPAAAANRASITFDNSRHHEESDVHPISHPPSPVIPRHRARRASSVDIGHFDPEGVEELRRTLSRLSANRQNDDANKSEITLPVGDGPFNFEKCLRDVVKKYASS
jgi:ATP-binding cassette subfamily G (WHITE) protein 2 (SNQ2)